MYNRYIRTDSGTYSRIPQEEPSPQRGTPPPDSSPSGETAPSSAPPVWGSVARGDGLSGLLRHFLDQLHLDRVDAGDLLLLGLLFFLLREDADEELLVALGLLLIL